MKSNFNFKTVILLFLMLSTSQLTVAQSDSEKVNIIVNQMLKAMGGIKNYNNTHFIQWEFGKRKLYWDKWSGDVRVESPENNQCILVNVNTLKGKVFENGILVEDEAKTNKLLNQAKNWWINDSYWLVMPWKLQDPGVTLTYIKTDILPNGKTADVLQMTFNAVGVTPDNKYWVYVDQEDHLIKQWSFYKNFNDAEPQFTRAWDNYQKTGEILLSFDRSKGAGGPRNVIVSSNLDSAIFTKL
ncbi:hypothetical protein SLW70_12975 [Flavobacterium sp. NG2]|uniref:hypothetical protein n=1 Tax=Flavobacterium sp. NG2 TaxID=3097547 RepID=UPI002A83406A|nr:hypothetical protein [Flavobacterium sp. NG2]WPR70838.1 hypothetical protein SLW70_12975 [Flavobacterium sp. NG2]